MGMHVPGMSWREIREAAVLAEELGYSCITMGESWGEDALTSLAQLAAVTTRIRIGTQHRAGLRALAGQPGHDAR